MTTRFPLSWPQHVPRRPSADRKKARFSKRDGRGVMSEVTVAEALRRLDIEVELLGCSHVILSTNIELRLDGSPRSGRPDPSDPGAALYFQRRGKSLCLPCDQFDRVADNIAGIAGHIHALRDIERYGVATTQQMFTGFEALPAPGSKRDWREILGLSPGQVPTPDGLGLAYRRAAKAAVHESALKEINIARDEAKEELGYQ